MKTPADMTLEELTALIDARVKRVVGSFDRDLLDEEADTRAPEEIFASIDRNMWAPPPGAKSSLELLREDRDR